MHPFRLRDATQQLIDRRLLHTRCAQPLGIAPLHQIALVGIARVMRGIRCQHHLLPYPDRAEVRKLLQVEIGQPVVDQIDALAAAIHAVIARLQSGGVGDQRNDSRALEHALRQQEFRIEVLRFGSFIHDGDAGERCSTMRQPPFVAEHGEETLFQIRCGNCRAGPIRHARTLDQQGVEEPAARVGVDLDQMRALRIEVKIVAVENAVCAVWHGRIDDFFHRRDHCAHLPQL